MDYPLKPLLLQSGPRLGLFITLFQTRSYPCAQQISLFFTLQATQVRPLRLKDALYIACYGVPGVLPSERRSDKLLSLSPDCSSSGPPVTDEEGGLCVIHDPWDSTGNPVRRPSPSCGARSEISVTPKELHQTESSLTLDLRLFLYLMRTAVQRPRIPSSQALCDLPRVRYLSSWHAIPCRPRLS